jgi:hypothetical protein
MSDTLERLKNMHFKRIEIDKAISDRLNPVVTTVDEKITNDSTKSKWRVTSEGAKPLTEEQAHLVGLMCVLQTADLEPEIIEGGVQEYIVDAKMVIESNHIVPYTYEEFVTWAFMNDIVDCIENSWVEACFDEARKFLKFTAEKNQDFVIHFQI